MAVPFKETAIDVALSEAEATFIFTSTSEPSTILGNSKA